MTWQPIETAPKDGSFILLFGGEMWDFDHDEMSEPLMVSARWVPCEAYPENSSWHYSHHDGGYYGEYVNPTHWMPLPEPPA